MVQQFITLALSLLLFSCSSVNETNEVIERMKKEDLCKHIVSRKTIGEISKSGVIFKNNYNDYLLKSEEGMIYFACNLPSKFQREGIKIEFTGEEKEIYPNEKTVGKFLVLNSLKTL